MTSAPAASTTNDPDAAIQDRPDVPRVRLRTGAAAGPVDGAWWPRSRDLAGELGALLHAVAPDTGPVCDVGFHPDDWNIVRIPVVTVDRPVGLTVLGSTSLGTVHVLGSRRPLVLLVVHPDTSELGAADILAAVLSHGHVSGAQTLLHPHGPWPHPDLDAVTQRVARPEESMPG